MKLAILIPVMNQFEITEQALRFHLDNTTSDIYLLDNNSDEDLSLYLQAKSLLSERVIVIKNFDFGGPYNSLFTFLNLKLPKRYELIAYLHSDMFVYDAGWDERVLETFQKHSKLGVLGFIGSDEIDALGGRGLGTVSNFMGKQTGKWEGSPAEVHGKRITDYRKAAVVDGCVMIFRKKIFNDVYERAYFPPHHFYDRLLCCEAIENGYEVGVLGVACDHISGQTANQESKYHDQAREWLQRHKVSWSLNPDHGIYQEAERQFLHEYRDMKKMIPFKV